VIALLHTQGAGLRRGSPGKGLEITIPDDNQLRGEIEKLEPAAPARAASATSPPSTLGEFR
jgi:hypothetical protein